MKLKKVCAITLAGMMLFAAGCGNSNDKNNSDKKESSKKLVMIKTEADIRNAS